MSEVLDILSGEKCFHFHISLNVRQDKCNMPVENIPNPIYSYPKLNSSISARPECTLMERNTPLEIEEHTATG